MRTCVGYPFGPRVTGATQVAVFWPWQKGFVCAVTGGGALRCEGINDRGQTGSETLDGPFDLVVRTARVSDVAEVRIGRSSSCARTGAGEVWCWAVDDAPTFAQKITAAKLRRVDAVSGEGTLTPTRRTAVYGSRSTEAPIQMGSLRS